ncbi:MAG: hypothetical protein AAF902_15400 [Chloroflexota bacterium]
MMNRKNNIHEEIQELLVQKNTLWPDELSRVNAHLKVCDQCQSFANFLEEMNQRNWNPYASETVSAQEKQSILRMIELNQRSRPQKSQQNIAAFTQSIASVAFFVILAALLFLIVRPDLGSVAFLSSSRDKSIERDYDGWELGVAFDVPDELKYQFTVVVEGYQLGNVMGLSNRPIMEEDLFSPWKLDVGETRAMISVKNPIFDLSGNPEVHMHEFSGYFNGFSGNYEFIEFAGRTTYFLESNYLGRDYVDATFFTGERLVRIYIEGKPDSEGNMPDIKNMARLMAESMLEVEYDGWQTWQDNELNMHIVLPENLSATDNIGGQSLFIFEENAELNEDWIIWYGHSSQVTKLSAADLREMGGLFLESPEFDILEYGNLSSMYPTAQLVQDLSDELPNHLQRMSLYETRDGQYLLAAAMFNWISEYDPPLLVMTLQFDQSELDSTQFDFSKVWRGMRTTTVPLIKPEQLIADPYYGQHSTVNSTSFTNHVGTEMVTDFSELELVIESISQKLGKTQVNYFLRPSSSDIAQFSAQAIEGRLFNELGNEIPYAGGSSELMRWGDDGSYNPPSTVRFDGALNHSPNNTLTLFVDVILFWVEATNEIFIDLSSREWGDYWTINQTTHFNGASVTFTEVWLDEEDQILKMRGELNQSNSLYHIKDLYHTQNSDVQLKLEGAYVELNYQLQTLEQTSISLFLQSTIQYEDAISVSFIVNEQGDVIKKDG